MPKAEAKNLPPEDPNVPLDYGGVDEPIPMDLFNVYLISFR